MLKSLWNLCNMLSVSWKLCVRSSACMTMWPRMTMSSPSRRVRWSTCSIRTTVIGGKESLTGGRGCFRATTSNSLQTRTQVHSVSIATHAPANFSRTKITHHFSTLTCNVTHKHGHIYTVKSVALSYTHTPTPEPGVEMLSLFLTLDWFELDTPLGLFENHSAI